MKPALTIQLIPQHSGNVRTWQLRRWQVILLGILLVGTAMMSAALALNATRVALLVTTAGEFQFRVDSVQQENDRLREALRVLDTIRREQEQIYAVAQILTGDSSAPQAPNGDPALVTDKELEQYIARYRKGSGKVKGSTPNMKPVIGIVTRKFSPEHQGVDIAALLNDPIYAPSSGVVVEVGVDKDLGNYLMLDHGEGWATRYGHLDRILVRKGDPIRRGASIGTIGMTGNTSGPHLHYEMTQAGTPVDPSEHFGE